MENKKQKAKALMARLKELEKLSDTDSFTFADSAISEEIKKTHDSIKNNASIKMLDKLNKKIELFKKDFDLTPFGEGIDSLEQSLEGFKEEVSNSLNELSASFEEKLGKLTDDLKNSSGSNEEKSKEFSNTIKELKESLAGFSDFTTENDTSVREFLKRIDTDIKGLKEGLTKTDTETREGIKKTSEDSTNSLTSFTTSTTEAIDKLRKEFLTRIANLGGGAQNRKITFSGTDYLTRYTDINYKAGTNITFTVANNDTTKMVDVTIASSGGAGTVRIISSISTPTTAGAAANTDYVYLVTGTTTLTLPTAVGNSNLYTVKNVGSGTVTVATTSSQTIDGSSSITLPVQYTSVDLISDTANWNVT